MVMGLVLKLPQITKIYYSGSVAGISITAYYMETFNYINSSASAVHLGLPVSVWGDPLIPTFFNTIIVFMMWYFDAKSYSAIQKILYITVLMGWTVFMFSEDMKPDWLPPQFWDVITLSSVFLNTSARIPQLWKNF